MGKGRSYSGIVVINILERLKICLGSGNFSNPTLPNRLKRPELSICVTLTLIISVIWTKKTDKFYLSKAKQRKKLEMMKKGAPIDDDWDKDIYSQEPDSKKNDQNLNEKDEKVQVVESASGEKTIRAAHVPVPTQDEIQAAMLRKKKLELLQMFASETLSSQSIEAKILLG